MVSCCPGSLKYNRGGDGRRRSVGIGGSECLIAANGVPAAEYKGQRRNAMKNNRRGFTLAELLIVVAVIAVLVAVSVPILTSRLEKSRESTDMANMRSAKAEAVVMMLEEPDLNGTVRFFAADRGILVTSGNRAAVDPYGRGTGAVGEEENTQDGYEPATNYSGAIIRVSFTDDMATLEWVRNWNTVGMGTVIGKAVYVGGEM